MRPAVTEIFTSHHRGRSVHVFEVRANNHIVDKVPEPLQERLRFWVRRIQGRDVRRVRRIVERILVPGQHLTGDDGYMW